MLAPVPSDWITRVNFVRVWLNTTWVSPITLKRAGYHISIFKYIIIRIALIICSPQRIKLFEASMTVGVTD